MQLIMIDKLEIKIILANKVDDKVNNKTDKQIRKNSILVSIITIITIAYNSQIHKYYSI